MNLKNSVLFLLFFVCTGFSVHKFYMAIYQVNHNVAKKRLEITARIFVDDLNTALDKKFKTKHFLGAANESETDRDDLKKYLSEKLKIIIGKESKTLVLKSNALEGNVLVCYLTAIDVSKITSLEVHNAILTEIFDEQENMMHFHLNGTKHTLVLDAEKTKGMLK
ncbi:DUF6702 family protein [Flavobacterium sp.]|uniref:DUF6702 family protein n=1 Tax=Flavobacterium sp. TaxID=239 RepID=UPI003450D93F